VSALAASLRGASWPIHACQQNYFVTIMGPFKYIGNISLE